MAAAGYQKSVRRKCVGRQNDAAPRSPAPCSLPLLVVSSRCRQTSESRSTEKVLFLTDREKIRRTEKVPEFRGLFKGLWQSLAVRFFGLETSHS